MDARIRDEVAAAPDQKPKMTAGQVWLTAISVLLLLLGLGCLAAIVWVWTRDWPAGLKLLATLGLVGLVVALLPRPGRIPKGAFVPADQGVELRRLLADVAAAVGTPVPDSVLVTMDMNAAVARYGWRQRSVLIIGAPLWLVLPPAARLSVLAHEFGHLSNNDPMRALSTWPARTFGARAVRATGGRNPWRRAVEGADSLAWDGGGVLGIVVHGALAVVNTAAATVQLLVDAVAMPDSRRAEFLADVKAREVAGTAAVVQGHERFLISREVLGDLWERAPRITAAQLPEAIDESVRSRSRQVHLLRQISVRTTDLWSSHPAQSDRLALMEALPEIEGSLRVDPARWAVIDAEMSAWTDRIHRSLLGTRETF